MLNKFTPAALGLVLIAVSACGNNKPMGKGFGDSVRHNMSVQIINPTPPHRTDGAPEMSGLRATGAIHRYQAGEVKELKLESTSKKQSK